MYINSLVACEVSWNAMYSSFFIPAFVKLFPLKLGNLPTHHLRGCHFFLKFEYPILMRYLSNYCIPYTFTFYISFQPESVLFLINSGYSENRTVSYNVLKCYFHDHILPFPD